MKKFYILFSLLLFQVFCCVNQVNAQDMTVKGTVIDGASASNAPLIGATIFILDGVDGQVSDVNGQFQIKAKVGQVIVVKYTGYTDYQVTVTPDTKDIIITLEESALKTDDVVITGLSKTSRKTLLSSVTSVSTEELDAPATSLNNLLGGRVAGVISIQTSGEPGKNISDFWIRGISTFGASSSALVLVDGLEGTLSDIDVADIESFQVLKDASATAVYGVRGANGVVLVTTKRGQVDKLQITARANITISELTNMPEYLESYDYAVLANEARVVSDLDILYSDQELDLIKYNLDPDLYPNVNWRDEILNTTSIKHNYYVSARGGSSIARYFISLTAAMETAAYKQDETSRYNTRVGYDTYSYRSNLDINLTKSTKLYLGIDGYITNTSNPGGVDTDTLWEAQRNLTPLTIPTMYSDGSLPAYNATNSYSPYVMLNHTGTSSTNTYKNMVTLAIEQDLSVITEGLTFKVQGALNTSNTMSETRYIMPDLYQAIGRTTTGELQLVQKVYSSAATYSSSSYFWRKYFLESTMNYDKVVNDDHRFSGLLYYYLSDEADTGNSTSMDAIPKRYQGISARFTYGYKDTYLLDFNFGYTGSENFEPGSQYGFFPSIALGWIPTEYDFMQRSMPWLNFLKFRASYGTAGNDEISDSRFPYLTIVNSTASTAWGASTYGITESTIGADNLEWEKAIKTNIGVDARLFNDRLTFTVDYYTDYRDGIFQQRAEIPDYVGLISLPYGNVGAMRSYGSDGNIAYTHVFNNEMSATLRANFTYSTNYIESWEEAEPDYEYQRIAGNSYNLTRGYIALGLFEDQEDINTSPSQFGTTLRPGDIKYKDVNGDGVIDTDDQVPLSYNYYPRLQYGFGGEFTYKKFTVSVMFKGTGTTDIYHVGMGYDAGYVPFYGGETGNVLTVVNDQENRWTPASYSGDPSTENPDAMYPRLTYGYSTNNSQLSTFWHDDARYIRLQEVSLSYKLNTVKALRAVGVKSIDLQLVGYNLAIWGPTYTDYDPEQAMYNGSAYPITRTYSLQAYLYF